MINKYIKSKKINFLLISLICTSLISSTYSHCSLLGKVKSIFYKMPEKAPKIAKQTVNKAFLTTKNILFGTGLTIGAILLIAAYKYFTKSNNNDKDTPDTFEKFKHETSKITIKGTHDFDCILGYEHYQICNWNYDDLFSSKIPKNNSYNFMKIAAEAIFEQAGLKLMVYKDLKNNKFHAKLEKKLEASLIGVDFLKNGIGKTKFQEIESNTQELNFDTKYKPHLKHMIHLINKNEHYCKEKTKEIYNNPNYYNFNKKIIVSFRKNQINKNEEQEKLKREKQNKLKEQALAFKKLLNNKQEDKNAAQNLFPYKNVEKIICLSNYDMPDFDLTIFRKKKVTKRNTNTLITENIIRAKIYDKKSKIKFIVNKNLKTKKISSHILPIRVRFQTTNTPATRLSKKNPTYSQELLNIMKKQLNDYEKEYKNELQNQNYKVNVKIELKNKI